MIALVYFLIGFVNVALAVPADGLLGLWLGLIGVACLWRGWFLVIRRNRGGAR